MMSIVNSEKGRLRLWLSIFSFYLTVAAHSQSAAEKGFPFITNYTSKVFNALPQTWAVIEDKRGIMYFGAQNCILEYDGVAWRRVVFEGAPPPVVRALAADSSGRIYYGSVGDIGYLSTDQFGKTKAVSLLNLIPEQYRNFFDIWSIRVGKDGIYFQAREYIFRVDGKQKVKVFIPKALFSFGFYLDGTYYVHELGIGLQRLVNDQFELIPGSGLIKNERIRLMLPYGTSAGQNQYLIGTFYTGLYLYDGKTIVPFKSEADDIIKTAMLYGGIVLPGGNYALATTGKGVLIMDKGGKLIQIINRDVGLQDESIYNMYYGKDGTLWMALDNGISKLETNSPFTRFTNQSGINTSTLNLSRFEGKLFLGTNNGLLEFDDKKAMFIPNRVVQPNQIFYLLQSERELLVPSDGLYSIRNGVTRKVVSSESNLIGMHKSVFHPDVLYAGTSLGVQVFYRNKKGDWEDVGRVPGTRDQFWTFTETSEGYLWAGTQNQVAYLIKPFFDADGKPVLDKFTFKKYGAEHGLVNGVGQVNEMFGDTWFVADTLFYRFDMKKERFYADSSLGIQRHGGGNSEGDITKDHLGRYWVRWWEQ